MTRKFFFISLLIISFGAKAQDVLTFADCLNQAMANNLKLKNAAYDEKIALYHRQASFGKLLPRIYAEAENRNSWGKEIDSHTNLYVTNNLRNTEGTLNAYLTLFSGFSNLSTILLAKQQLEINKTEYQQAKNEITIDLALRYITILYLQEIITANEEQIKSSEKQLEVGDLKFNQGAISESEVFKIRSQKASEELRLLNTKNELADNMIALKQLMNMPLDKEIVLMKPELNLNENVVLEDDQQSVLDQVLRQHPMYKLSLLEEQKAKLELAQARAPSMPTLTMRLLYRSNYSTTDFDNISFSEQLDENTSKGIRFYLTIPIFSQFDNYGKIQAGKLRYKQAKVNTEIEQNRLSREVLKAINDAKTSLKKSESSNIAFTYSQKSYEADTLKFEVGKININELNTSKMIFNTTQAELIQAKYELLFNNALIKFYLGEQFTL